MNVRVKGYKYKGQEYDIRVNNHTGEFTADINETKLTTRDLFALELEIRREVDRQGRAQPIEIPITLLDVRRRQKGDFGYSRYVEHTVGFEHLLFRGWTERTRESKFTAIDATKFSSRQGIMVRRLTPHDEEVYRQLSEAVTTATKAKADWIAERALDPKELTDQVAQQGAGKEKKDGA